MHEFLCEEIQRLEKREKLCFYNYYMFLQVYRKLKQGQIESLPVPVHSLLALK